MSLDSAMFETLGQFAVLANLVGVRIYPDQAPQETAKPYVVWQEISGGPVNDLGGSASSSSLEMFRVQVTSWALTRNAAITVRAQVRLAMEAATQFKSNVMDMRSLGKDAETKLNGAQVDFSVQLNT